MFEGVLFAWHRNGSALERLSVFSGFNCLSEILLLKEGAPRRTQSPGLQGEGAVRSSAPSAAAAHGDTVPAAQGWGGARPFLPRVRLGSGSHTGAPHSRGGLGSPRPEQTLLILGPQLPPGKERKPRPPSQKDPHMSHTPPALCGSQTK